MGTDRGLCGLAFAAETGREAAMADLRGALAAGGFVEAPERLAALGRGGLRRRGEARLHLIGAPFQIKVWEALLQVPSGHVTTYSDIAGGGRASEGGARGRHRGGAQPGQLADPVPPGAAARPAGSAAITGGWG